MAGAWGRPGAIYDAGTNRVFVASGNGTYDPTQNYWGDSVVAINPDGTGAAGKPLDSYTPANFLALQNGDVDLGSTAPAILPVPLSSNVQHLAVQGGKDGKLRLVNLANLSGQGGPGHTSGEVGTPINVPQIGEVRSQPAVWANPAWHNLGVRHDRQRVVGAYESVSMAAATRRWQRNGPAEAAPVRRWSPTTFCMSGPVILSRR